MKGIVWKRLEKVLVIFASFKTSSKTAVFAGKLRSHWTYLSLAGSQRRHFWQQGVPLSTIHQNKNSVMQQRDSNMNALPDDSITKDPLAIPTTRPRLCPKCHGEGKISKPPSRKARLRHKRKMEAMAEHDSNGESNPVKLQRRLDPCPRCFRQSGLVWEEDTENGMGDSTLAVPGTISAPLSTTKNLHVAIIGGGIGGMALATALLHRGISCRVFEKDACFHQRSQGYGLTLQQARRALLALGIRDYTPRDSESTGQEASNSFLKGDAITSTKHVVHTTDGTVVGEWGLRKWEGTIKKRRDGNAKEAKSPKRQNLHVPRQTLRYALWEALQEASGLSPYDGKVDDIATDPRIPISWGHKLIDIQPSPATAETETMSRMRLLFHVKDSNDKPADTLWTEADLVVGCDGIRSSVRSFLFTSHDNKNPEKPFLPTPLRYLDCIVILGICPLKQLNPSIRKSCALLDGKTVFQTADGTTRIYLMPYSKKNDEYMWQLSFPVTEELAKEWSRKGSGALKKEALNKCGLWHEPIPEILSKTPTALVSGYPVYDRDLLTAEALANARNIRSHAITLLGDACHPMSPFKGQGANQALLDALSLARSIYRAQCQDNTSLETALVEFEEEMIGRSSTKVKASSEAAHFLHSDIAIASGDLTRGAAATIASSNVDGRSNNH
jgi:2-polyprenyl-6-methoxyphenol hydroxylase-like FAD-dependent oxidoreductase